MRELHGATLYATRRRVHSPASYREMSELTTSVKANSHIPCSSHAAPMPFSFHAVPIRFYIMPFPFDLHSAAVFDSHRPCRARAMSRPCRSEIDFSRPRHSTTWARHEHGIRELASAVQGRHEGDLPSFGFFRLPRGVP
jgi:hypothetical protein